ncbi:MAG: transcriptional repressor [Chloroflexota bacterium]
MRKYRVVQADTTIAGIRKVLQRHGLQATSARLAVLQILQEEHHHRSADEIRAEILERYPALDPATVYRTLETLEENGLVVRMELGDKRTRWAHVTHDHHHLACRNCKAIIELPDGPFQQFADGLNQAHGVRVDMQHLVLRGLCPDCAKAEA